MEPQDSSRSDLADLQTFLSSLLVCRVVPNQMPRAVSLYALAHTDETFDFAMIQEHGEILNECWFAADRLPRLGRRIIVPRFSSCAIHRVAVVLMECEQRCIGERVQQLPSRRRPILPQSRPEREIDYQ